MHRAQSDLVPDVSRNFFTEYPSYPGFFLLYISDYQNISWIFMTCIPRAPRANCGIFIQEQIQIHFQKTKNFLEKIQIWDLMVAGGNLLPLSFFFKYFLNIFNFTISFGNLRIGESMVVEKLLPFSFDLCQPQYFSRRRTSKAKYIRGWLPSYFQL